MNDDALKALKARGDQIKQKLNAVLEQDKELGDEVQESEYYIGEVDTGITHLCLCEQNGLVLRPDRVYVFNIDPNCADCAEIAEAYKNIW